MCLGNSLKYVPISEFMSYLQSRYDCHRFKCSHDANLSSPEFHSNLEPTQRKTQILIDQLADSVEFLAELEGPLVPVKQQVAD